MPDRRLVVNHRETSRFPSSGTRVENPSKTSLARRPPQQIARQSSHPRALLRVVGKLRIVCSEHYRATGPAERASDLEPNTFIRAVTRATRLFSFGITTPFQEIEHLLKVLDQTSLRRKPS